MNNLVIIDKKPATGTITRIIDKFENANPFKLKQNQAGIIKNYIYVENKRIIA